MANNETMRHSCNYAAPRRGLANLGDNILPEHARGGLYMGLATALTFGVCAMHWALVVA